MRDVNVFKHIDWVLVFLYLLLVFLGWLNIYAAVYNDEHSSIFDFTQNYGNQLIWIIFAIVFAFMILMLEVKFFPAFAYAIYTITIFLLIAVLLFGVERSGSKSWFQFGGVGLQPAEFAKFATALAIAKFLSSNNVDIKKIKNKLILFLIIALPTGLILLQNDMGSALVYTSFLLVLYREGISSNIIIIGVLFAILFLVTLLFEKFIVIGVIGGIAFLIFLFIRRRKKYFFTILLLVVISSGFVYSVDYVFENVLEPHQRTRINVLLGKETDLRGAGYNVNQSKIAIGSGGLWGKGYLQGTQTKFDFVPEQSTDFIFCTIGEEWGFIGSSVLIILFIALLIRLVQIAERQRSVFSRVYGYCVISILSFHIAINIGMTIGFFPVIGIPLPFFSYGGSSLWGFTFLLFIFIKLDAQRLEVL